MSISEVWVEGGQFSLGRKTRDAESDWAKMGRVNCYPACTGRAIGMDVIRKRATAKAGVDRSTESDKLPSPRELRP